MKVNWEHFWCKIAHAFDMYGGTNIPDCMQAKIYEFMAYWIAYVSDYIRIHYLFALSIVY